MEEEVMTTQQETGADQASWLDGWEMDGEPQEGAAQDGTQADQQEEAGDGAAQEAGEEAEAKGETQEASDTESGKDQPEGGEEEFSLPIRYMGKDEVITSKAEAIILAQKGRNYDSVYQRMQEAETFRAENENAVKLMQQLADMTARNSGKEGMTIPEYVELCSLQLKMNQGLSEEQARRELALEKREAAVERLEKGGQQQAGKESGEESAADRVARDKSVFQRAFPEVDAGKLPQEVWAELAKAPEAGLTVAYARYLARQTQELTAQAQQAKQAAQQRADARKRSPGSMKNTNPKPAKSREDELLAGWEFS